MKTIKVRTAKPGMVIPLVAGVGHNTTAKAITHDTPVEVHRSAFIERRLAKGDLEVVKDASTKRDLKPAKSAKPGKES